MQLEGKCEHAVEMSKACLLRAIEKRSSNAKEEMDYPTGREMRMPG